MTTSDLIQRRLCALVAGVIVAVLAAVSATPAAHAAKRPPAPAGLPRVSPGQLPKPCSAGDAKYGFTGNGSVLGTYYDTRVKQWVNGPHCYPVWGFLTASGPQIVDPGQTAAVVATPTDGSNSGQYAPEARSISWIYAGKREAGCQTVDLTCSMVPTSRATGSWQWFQVEVSMPRTFFIFSHGDLCANNPICPGAETHAWSWIGVRPKARNGCAGRPRCVKLSGTIIRREWDVEASGFQKPAVRPVSGVRVTATRGHRHLETSTHGNGTYSLPVPRGHYVVSVSGDKQATEPKARTVTATRDTGGLDFTLCRPSPNVEDLSQKGCRLVRIDGTITDMNGALFPPADLIRSEPPRISSERPGIVVQSASGDSDGSKLSALQDITAVDPQGRFSIWTTPGPTTLLFTVTDDGRPTQSVHVQAPGKNLRLKVLPAVAPVKAEPTLVTVFIGFLPGTSAQPLTFDLERSEPVVNDFCRYRQTADVSWVGNLASASLSPGNGYFSFCTGSYTASVLGADGTTLATGTFDVTAGAS